MPTCELCGHETPNREKCKACRQKAQPGPYYPFTSKQIRAARNGDDKPLGYVPPKLMEILRRF